MTPDPTTRCARAGCTHPRSEHGALGCAREECDCHEFAAPVPVAERQPLLVEARELIDQAEQTWRVDSVITGQLLAEAVASLQVAIDQVMPPARRARLAPIGRGAHR